MVENAYKVTLVSAFFPLFLGLYWKRATSQGALAGIVAGLSTWLLFEYFGGGDGAVWPPQLVGFLAAGAAMVAGSLAPQCYGRARHPGAGRA
jgi:Na+/proline symporter